MGFSAGDRWNKWPNRIGRPGAVKTHLVSRVDEKGNGYTSCGFVIPDYYDDLVVTSAVTCGKCCKTMGVPKPPTTGDLLRMAAAGRREYAESAPYPDRTILLGEAEVLESAAKIADGDLAPLYGLLPSWRWGEAGLS